MIKYDENEEIIIETEEQQYKLNDTNDYLNFLLWVTSPSEDKSICNDTFTVDETIDESNRAKAERYSAFLCSFIKKRNETINANHLLSDEKREEQINAFLEKLKGSNDQTE